MLINMLNVISLLRRRHIHSTVRFCNVGLKFSNVETEKILSVVNNTSLEELVDRFKITKSRAQKLNSARERCGHLQSLHEILHIDGFGLKVLNTFCESILKEEAGLTSKTAKKEKPTSRSRSYTIPPISDGLRSHINSFTSIHVGMTAISWTTFTIIPNEITQITHWKSIKLPEPKLNLYNLVEFMSSTLKDLPKSDFYIFESPFIANPASSSKVQMNNQVNQMMAVASAIAIERNTLPNFSDDGVVSQQVNVAFLRKNLFSRLFKLYIGTERTSSMIRVADLIQPTNYSAETEEDIRTTVNVEAGLKSIYLSANRLDQDLMGCSFLLGVAFLRLSLLKCPISMKLLKE